jgi:hypothetical protein
MARNKTPLQLGRPVPIPDEYRASVVEFEGVDVER